MNAIFVAMKPLLIQIVTRVIHIILDIIEERKQSVPKL